MNAESRLSRVIAILAAVLVIGMLAQAGPVDAGKNKRKQHDRGAVGTEIVDGFGVADGQYRFVVSLQAAGPVSANAHFCTGALIGYNRVLTAGHCLYDAGAGRWETPASMKVVIGRAILNRPSAVEAVCAVAGFAVHPAYDPRIVTAANNRNDVAVVTTRCSATVMARLPKARLAGTTDAPEGKTLRVVGWGCTARDSCVSPVQARYGDFGIRSKEACMALTDATVVDVQQLFCATGTGFNGVRNPQVCFGDSGGPAFLYREGAPYIYGVTSFMYADGNCGDTMAGSVHADVTHESNRAWILRAAGL